MARPFTRWFANRLLRVRHRHGDVVQRGASLSEYALILSLVVTGAIGVIILLEDSSGSYLVDTGSDIGAPRGLAADFDLADPATPPWLTQPPPPTVPTYGPNLLVNGGFELPPGVVDFTVAAAPPWISTDVGVELWASGYFGVPAYEGVQMAELNVSSLTTYSQTVVVETGKTYQWSVAHRGRNNTDTAEVLINGAVVDTISTAPGAWVIYDGTFVATGTVVDFALRSVDNGSTGNMLDDVVLREWQNP